MLWVSGLLAALFWLSMEPPVQANEYEVDCPRPVSGTCFPRQWFGIEGEPYELTEFPDVRFDIYNTTYVYNVEAQSTKIPGRICSGSTCVDRDLEVNGFTLFGDFLAVDLRYVPVHNIQLYGGVFFAIPFGGDETIDDIRPILTFDYAPVKDLHLIAGTLQPRHLFFDAIFDDVLYFIRPVEQGIQMLVNMKYYEQDLFINWQQKNTKIDNEQFDVGYVGKLKFGPFHVNGQLHWEHEGGEIPFPDFRPLQARNNVAWLAGPEVVLSPAKYVDWLAWWDELGAAFSFMGTHDEPNSRTPEATANGHANELRGWVNFKGLRIQGLRWNSSNFLAAAGDRFYGVPKMTEVSLAGFFPLVGDISLELGALVRFIDDQSGTPPSVQYAAVHWNMDLDIGRFFRSPQ